MRFICKRAAVIPALPVSHLCVVPLQLITPDLFAMKYSWQFEQWFEVKEKKKSLTEAARRSKRPGQPLRDIVVEDGDREFDSDWESEEEGEAAAAERPLGATIADSLAEMDETGGCTLIEVVCKTVQSIAVE